MVGRPESPAAARPSARVATSALDPGYVIPIQSPAMRPSNISGTRLEENIRQNFRSLIDSMRSSVTAFETSTTPYVNSLMEIFDNAKDLGTQFAKDFSKTVNRARENFKMQRIKGDVDSYNAFTQEQIDEFTKLETALVGLDMTYPYNTIQEFVRRHRSALKRLFVYEFYRFGKPPYLSPGMVPRDYPVIANANLEVLVFLLIYTPDYDLTYTPFGTNISEQDAEMFITTGNPNVLIQSIEEADQRERTYEGGPPAAPEQFRPTYIFVDPNIGVKLDSALRGAQKEIIRDS